MAGVSLAIGRLSAITGASSAGAGDALSAAGLAAGGLTSAAVLPLATALPAILPGLSILFMARVLPIHLGPEYNVPRPRDMTAPAIFRLLCQRLKPVLAVFLRSRRSAVIQWCVALRCP